MTKLSNSTDLVYPCHKSLATSAESGILSLDYELSVDLGIHTLTHLSDSTTKSFQTFSCYLWWAEEKELKLRDKSVLGLKEFYVLDVG